MYVHMYIHSCTWTYVPNTSCGKGAVCMCGINSIHVAVKSRVALQTKVELACNH